MTISPYVVGQFYPSIKVCTATQKRPPDAQKASSILISTCMITWEDFEKVDIRVGTILEARPFPGARKPAYQLRIDFGANLGIKNSSAQITTHYRAEDLPGKQIVAVVNFPVKQIANFFSECLVLGVVESGGAVVLLSPDKAVENGLKIA
jgi:tRNA-binding protein